MCHHRGGNAIVSFFVSRDLPFEQMNTNKGTNIGTFGMPDARIIAAGDPWRSVMMYRLSRLGYARMPYIGSRVVDSDGVALLAQWIGELDPDPAIALSPPQHSDSADARALAMLAAPGAASAGSPPPQCSSSHPAPLERLHWHCDCTPDRVFSTQRKSARPRSKLFVNAPSDIRGLFDDFLPESLRKQSSEQHLAPETVLQQEGDALRGRLIFYSDAARCRTCHQLDDAAASIGPTLTEISRKYPAPGRTPATHHSTLTKSRRTLRHVDSSDHCGTGPQWTAATGIASDGRPPSGGRPLNHARKSQFGRVPAKQPVTHARWCPR
jgi:hypothetical protein